MALVAVGGQGQRRLVLVKMMNANQLFSFGWQVKTATVAERYSSSSAEHRLLSEEFILADFTGGKTISQGFHCDIILLISPATKQGSYDGNYSVNDDTPEKQREDPAKHTKTVSVTRSKSAIVRGPIAKVLSPHIRSPFLMDRMIFDESLCQSLQVECHGFVSLCDCITSQYIDSTGFVGMTYRNDHRDKVGKFYPATRTKWIKTIHPERQIEQGIVCTSGMN